MTQSRHQLKALGCVRRRGCTRECCLGLAASTLTPGRRRWFLLAMRNRSFGAAKTRRSTPALPLVRYFTPLRAAASNARVPQPWRIPTCVATWIGRLSRPCRAKRGPWGRPTRCPCDNEGRSASAVARVAPPRLHRSPWAGDCFAASSVARTPVPGGRSRTCCRCRGDLSRSGSAGDT